MFSWTIVASCVAGTMPITHGVDIKLSFEMFDMTPGQNGRSFRRSLLLHGGKSDAHGFSFADCFLRIDAHAVQRGQPIVVPPGGGVLAWCGTVAIACLWYVLT